MLFDENVDLNSKKIETIVNLGNRDNNHKMIEELMLNGRVEGDLKGFVFNEEYEKDDILTMLFYLGYITIQGIDFETIFKIPNYITNTVFSEYFVKELYGR